MALEDREVALAFGRSAYQPARPSQAWGLQAGLPEQTLGAVGRRDGFCLPCLLILPLPGPFLSLCVQSPPLASPSQVPMGAGPYRPYLSRFLLLSGHVRGSELFSLLALNGQVQNSPPGWLQRLLKSTLSCSPSCL